MYLKPVRSGKLCCIPSRNMIEGEAIWDEYNRKI